MRHENESCGAPMLSTGAVVTCADACDDANKRPSFVFPWGVSWKMGAQSVASYRQTVPCWALANRTTFEAHNSMDLPHEGVEYCCRLGGISVEVLQLRRQRSRHVEHSAREHLECGAGCGDLRPSLGLYPFLRRLSVLFEIHF